MPFIAAGSCEPLRVWSRLEPRTRQVDFADALAARIADPMFLLARQWQFGEFKGEDTGSAVLATLARNVTPVTVPAAAPDDGWEPIVERLPISFPLLLRARLGRALLSQIDDAADDAGTLTPAYDPAFYRKLLARLFGPLDHEPDADDLVATARDRAARRVARVRRALADHSVDGVRAYVALRSGMSAADLPAALTAEVPPGHINVLLSGLEAYRSWFATTYVQPVGGDNWEPDQLEYAFSATVPRLDGTTDMTAAEYTGGHLDWYSLDQGANYAGTSATSTDIRTVIPDPAEFPGMPKPRWWQFEDAAVDLGKLRADATDAARIVVSEFALLYGNNWFVVTCRQPVGTLAELEGVLVTDVFGWRTLVSPKIGSAGSKWTEWDLFSLSPRPSGGSTTPLPQHLLLPASLGHVLDAEPLESVAFVRDETADMVWALEQRVPDGLGASRDGAESARLVHAELTGTGPPPADTGGSDLDGSRGLRYRLQTEVAENWIPFIAVHKPNQTREIRLQRAAIARDGPPVGTRIRPVTTILRSGIAEDDSQASPYFVNEEEVPRAGVSVSGLLRRARRFDGVPVVWHARRVSSGRGSGHSGLEFDRIEEVGS